LREERPATPASPLPACGERVRVRGCASIEE
jgi:hypothetical protein